MCVVRWLPVRSTGRGLRLAAYGPSPLPYVPWQMAQFWAKSCCPQRERGSVVRQRVRDGGRRRAVGRVIAEDDQTDQQRADAPGAVDRARAPLQGRTAAGAIGDREQRHADQREQQPEPGIRQQAGPEEARPRIRHGRTGSLSRLEAGGVRREGEVQARVLGDILPADDQLDAPDALDREEDAGGAVMLARVLR